MNLFSLYETPRYLCSVKKNLFQSLKSLAALLVPLVAGGCSQSGPTDLAEPAGSAAGTARIEATVRATRGGATRTALEADGRTVRWSAGDRIAVWASDGSSTALDAVPFALHTFGTEFSAADFTATIDPMAEGSYTYYALYPLPAGHDGTQVYFDLPARQRGRYDASADLMAAAPVTGGPLGDAHDAPEFVFRHLCHAFRIEVPGGRNLFGRAVRRLEITFPTEVTGRLSLDAAAPDAVPVLSDGSRTVVLDFGESGLTDTAGDYAWFFVAPVALDGEVLFRAYDGEGYQAASLTTHLNKSLEAGHTTPVTLTLPEARPLHRFLFRVEENRLGEELGTLTLRSDEPLFATPFGNEERQSVTLEADADGLFRAAVYADTHPAAELQGLNLAADFESENALLAGRTLTLPDGIAASGDHEVAVTVPYLFEEDFSGLAPSFESHTEYKGSDALDPDPIDLGEYGLAGWTGARVGGSEGLNLRIMSRVEMGLGIPNRRPGRVDSAPVSGLKEGRSVRVRVQFDYAGDRYNGVGGASGNPLISFGHTTATGAIGVGTEVENALFTDRVIGIDGHDNNTAFYGNTPHTETQEFDGCTAQTRLTWHITNNRGASFSANGNYWLYIDNIRVSIVH